MRKMVPLRLDIACNEFNWFDNHIFDEVGKQVDGETFIKLMKLVESVSDDTCPMFNHIREQVGSDCGCMRWWHAIPISASQE